MNLLELDLPALFYDWRFWAAFWLTICGLIIALFIWAEKRRS